MGIEILIGNAIMGKGYSRYFHMDLQRTPHDLSDGKQLVREIAHFSRLVLVAVMALSGICLTYYATRYSFNGILTPIPTDTATFEALSDRCRLFCEFLAFLLTTFATVGYGDVHPTGIISRLLVAGIHLLTMSYILFLLQILLSQRQVGQPAFPIPVPSVPTGTPRPAEASADPPAP
jgi:hypothetical protein